MATDFDDVEGNTYTNIPYAHLLTARTMQTYGQRYNEMETVVNIRSIVQGTTVDEVWDSLSRRLTELYQYLRIEIDDGFIGAPQGRVEPPGPLFGFPCIFVFDGTIMDNLSYNDLLNFGMARRIQIQAPAQGGKKSRRRRSKR